MARPSADKAIDWDLVCRQYRLGQKSNTQLAAEFGVSVSAVGRRAAKEGWVVDKSKEVAAVTNSLLIQNASGNANPNATPTALEVKVAAQTNADIVLEHRGGLRRLRRLRDKLTDEVESITDNKALFDQIGELLDESGPDASGNWKRDKLNELYRKVISMSDRIDNTKKLAEIDEKIRKGEREAFSIGEEQEASTLDQLLKKISDEKVIA